MATVPIPVKLLSSNFGVEAMTSLAITHPLEVIKISVLPKTQGELGDSLAPRSNTSNSLFNWGN
jgi:hypothetical protein